MRKLLLAAAVCMSAAFLAPATQARTLATSPNQDSAMLIPTAHATVQALVVPVRYMHHRRHHRHHR